MQICWMLSSHEKNSDHENRNAKNWRLYIIIILLKNICYKTTFTKIQEELKWQANIVLDEISYKHERLT